MPPLDAQRRERRHGRRRRGTASMGFLDYGKVLAAPYLAGTAVSSQIIVARKLAAAALMNLQ